MELGKAIRFTALVLILLNVNIPAASAQTVTMSISPASNNINAGEIFSISVILSPEDSNVYGAEFEILFDKTVVEGVSVVKGPLLESDGASTLEVVKPIDNTNGKISYSISRKDVGSGINSSGTLAYVTFKGVNAGSSALNLNNVIISDPSSLSIPSTTITGSVNVAEVQATPTPTPTDTPSTPGANDSDTSGPVDNAGVPSVTATGKPEPALNEDKTLEVLHPDSTILFLSSEVSETTQGDVFSVNVYVKSTEPVYGVEFKLSYDKHLAEGISLEQGSFLGGSVIVNEINNEKGEMVYAETRFGNVTGIKSKAIAAKASFKARNPGNITIQPESIRFVNDNEEIIGNVPFSGIGITIHKLPKSRGLNASGILGVITAMLIAALFMKAGKRNKPIISCRDKNE
jgi:hypothetical protein